MDSANEMQGAFDQALIETQAHSLLSRLADFLKGQNVGAYLVGGFVRDVLLGEITPTSILPLLPMYCKSARGLRLHCRANLCCWTKSIESGG